MFWLFLMQVASPPAAPPPSARPRTIFSRDDYPLEAVRHGWEGDVIADLTVSPTGQVSSCKIIESSGHPVLDDATCQLLIKRARFTPATDINGSPTEGHFRTPPVHWRLSH
jgi:protein TonB